jgi:hypothetical protein
MMARVKIILATNDFGMTCLPRIRTVHADDPLAGREWGLECFVCAEHSYLGPSMACVEALGDVVLCARCHADRVPLPVARLARLATGPAVLERVDRLTWMPLPPVVVDRFEAPSDTICRLARAGLDERVRSYFNSLSHMQQEALEVDALFRAAVEADRDELVEWLLQNVASTMFGADLCQLVYYAYDSFSVRCIAALTERCQVAISSDVALARLARHDDIPPALFVPLCTSGEPLSRFDLSRLFASVAPRFGNAEIIAKLLELGAPNYSWYGKASCSATLRQLIASLDDETRKNRSGSILHAALESVPPDVSLLRQLMAEETSTLSWGGRMLVNVCETTRAVELVRVFVEFLELDVEERADLFHQAIKNSLSIGALNVADLLLSLVKDAPQQLLDSEECAIAAARGGKSALAWLLERAHTLSPPHTQAALWEVANLTGFRSDFVRLGGTEGVLDMFRMLRARGADVHATNDDGVNALFVACQTSGGDSAARPVVTALLGPEFGLDPKTTSSSGETLLHVTRDPVIFEQLMKVLDVEAETRSRITPIVAACRSKSLDIVSQLLHAGVSLSADVLDRAVDERNWGVVRLLHGKRRLPAKCLSDVEVPLDIVQRALAAGAKAATMVRRSKTLSRQSAGRVRLLLAHSVPLSMASVAAAYFIDALCAMIGAGVGEPPEGMLLDMLSPGLGADDTAILLVANGAHLRDVEIEKFDRCVFYVEKVRFMIAAGVDPQCLIEQFPERRDVVEKALLLKPWTFADARLALELHGRRMVKTRFIVERVRMLEICIALQMLRLPALVTLTVLDQTNANAKLSPLHWKWDLVTKVKHFRK